MSVELNYIGSVSGEYKYQILTSGGSEGDRAHERNGLENYTWITKSELIELRDAANELLKDEDAPSELDMVKSIWNQLCDAEAEVKRLENFASSRTSEADRYFEKLQTLQRKFDQLTADAAKTAIECTQLKRVAASTPSGLTCLGCPNRDLADKVTMLEEALAAASNELTCQKLSTKSWQNDYHAACIANRNMFNEMSKIKALVDVAHDNTKKELENEIPF